MSLFGLWLILYGSFALSRPPLPDGPDTMHAEIAREMVTRNDWTTAYANGLPVHSNSKLLDWSIAASFQLFGVSDWSARLPISLCALGLALTLFFFARKLFASIAAGFYAALFFLVWPGTFLATRDLTGRSLLCFGTTLLALLLWHFLVEKNLAGGNAAAVVAAALALVALTAGWPGMLLPAFIVVLASLVRFRIPVGQRITVYLSLWLLCALIFGLAFEGPSRSPFRWIAPVPPLALLLGGLLARDEAPTGKASGRRIARYIFAIGLPVAAVALFFAIHGPVSLTAFHQSLVLTAPGGRIALFIASAAILVGAAGNLLFRRSHKDRVANCFLAGTLGGLIVAIQAGLVIGSPNSSSQILADAIRPELNPTDIVVIDGKYPDASSFAFYLERPVLLALPSTLQGKDSITMAAPPKGTVAVDQAWEGSSRVFLWTSADHPLPFPGKTYVVARSGGKQILSNEPNSAGAAF